MDGAGGDLGGAHRHLDPHGQNQPAPHGPAQSRSAPPAPPQPQVHPQGRPPAPAPPSGPAPASPAPPAANANTVQGAPHIAGSTVQVEGGVTNLHIHSGPANDTPNGQPPPHSPAPAPPGRTSQPSGVIIRVEIGHQRYIEIFDEGLARYIINAHLKEMGLGHD